MPLCLLEEVTIHAKPTKELAVTLLDPFINRRKNFQWAVVLTGLTNFSQPVFQP